MLASGRASAAVQGATYKAARHHTVDGSASIDARRITTTRIIPVSNQRLVDASRRDLRAVASAVAAAGRHRCQRSRRQLMHRPPRSESPPTRACSINNDLNRWRVATREIPPARPASLIPGAATLSTRRPSPPLCGVWSRPCAAPKKQNPGTWPGFCVRIERVAQFALRRLMKPSPARPRPSKPRVAGSGTEPVGLLTSVIITSAPPPDFLSKIWKKS
jgi:hypothetical protein